MTHRTQMKDAFDIDLKYAAFFTGGTVIWTDDGSELLCQNTDVIAILNVSTGTVTQSIGASAETPSFASEEDTDVINTFALSYDNETLVTSHKSGLFKWWSRSDGQLKKIWKSIHTGPVSKLTFSRHGQLASGGVDGAIRQWNVQQQACTHNLKGSQGVVSALLYHGTRDIIFGAADDTKIRAWDTQTGDLKHTFVGHYSKITSICMHEDGVHLASASRDKVIILWNLLEGGAKRTVPVFEGIEGLAFVPNLLKITDCSGTAEGIYVATAGEFGVIKIWDMLSAKEVYLQTNSLINKATESGGLAITQLLYNPVTSQLAVISADHNIILHDLETFKCEKQFVGFSDDILDLLFLGENDSLLAVATNSCDIKLYTNSTMNCHLLKGHTDIVLALTGTPSNANLLISSSKDNTIRIWRYDTANTTMSCVGIGSRHTASVGSVAASQTNATFITSVSQDTCLKLWEIPPDDSKEAIPLTCTHTAIAHLKDINSVAVSPNDKLIATGSQDKTAKLWSTDGLNQLAVFRGHRRGIWCVRFSPLDQVLLSTSADCSVKLWSLTEYNCLKTIVGYDSSVLRAEFISRGMQILTSGGDGLIKVWNIKTSECMVTLDGHDGRVWALAVSGDGSTVVSGGSDSLLVKWKDVTVEKREEAVRKSEEQVVQEQELHNLVKNKQFLKALRLALRLGRSFHILKIIEQIIKSGGDDLNETLSNLSEEHKESLLRTTISWNTNSKRCHVAQLVLNTLVNQMLNGDFRPNGLAGIIEELMPYTERHYKRLTQHYKDLHYVTYCVNRMQPFANMNT